MSYTWEDPIIAAPTFAFFSCITVYNAGVSLPASIRSSISFRFRSSIMSGVSKPAGIDEIPLGVIRPLNRRNYYRYYYYLFIQSRHTYEDSYKSLFKPTLYKKENLQKRNKRQNLEYRNTVKALLSPPL